MRRKEYIVTVKGETLTVLANSYEAAYTQAIEYFLADMTIEFTGYVEMEDSLNHER